MPIMHSLGNELVQSGLINTVLCETPALDVPNVLSYDHVNIYEFRRLCLLDELTYNTVMLSDISG